VAVVATSCVDLVLLLWLTLPRIGVTMSQMMGRLVRPAFATLVMIAVLWRLDLAWTTSAGTGAIDFAQDAATRSTIGAICYGVVLALLWLLAGRPEGAERFSITTVGKVCRHLRHRVR
jgi:hypothetical protein